MPDLLSLIDPGEVRAALDPTGALLDPASLPNSVIARKLYSGAAVTELLALDPGAAGREDEGEVARIANALNLLTAANIAPFVVQITKETLGEESLTYQAVDWEGRAGKLRARARSEVAAVTEVDEGKSYLPTMFSLACGRRGR